MYIPFMQLSDAARIWIYQASRPLTQEASALLQKVQDFVEQWAAHGRPLQGSATLRYDQFLILAVEESLQSVTGCEVDASIQLVRDQERAFQITLLDRTCIAFRQEQKNMLVPLAQLAAQIQQGIVAKETLIFDNTITKKGDLADKWLVPAQATWLGKYFTPCSD